MENGLIYDREIEYDFDNLSLEHKTVLNLIQENSDILELGCHTGYFSYWLKKKNCNVTGIDIYGPCIEKAKIYLNKGIIGNIEEELTWKEIENEQYDVILLMHVLEHLINPEDILKRFRSIIKKEGKIIICLPNISNWNSRVNILKGNFNYEESGLMDKTHLRFFNYFTASQLIKNSGFNISSYKGTSKVYFHPLPNFRLIWRGNKILTNLILNIFHKKANLIDSVMVFEIKPS